MVLVDAFYYVADDIVSRLVIRLDSNKIILAGVRLRDLFVVDIPFFIPE